MKKATPDALPLQEELSPENDAQELAQVIPIRTETTLTRYPFHRIAKKANVLIKQTSKNERGKVITTWEVKHPPGPLAYKLDTLIINRRIDEMRSRGEIRPLFRLGSLAEICRELGINPSGKNTNAVKDSLKENAGALITAKLSYKGHSGTEREFEFTTTRYTVIFTGEKLSNEKRADAVYIELHPRYHEMLKHSKTRPLNYEYLRELAPAPQRLYELLSFSMFGTLTHGRPVAQMLYSEFCQSAPLTRHTEFYRVRSQMRKIHKPHIESGYIKAVEFQETTDDSGVIDWLIKYTPGRRARHEFREFSTKRLLDKQPQKPRLVSPPKAAPPVQKEESDLVRKLREEFGIAADRARAIEDDEQHRANAHQWLAAKTYIHDWKAKGSGFWIEAITKPYELPPSYLTAKAKEREVQHALKKQAEREARDTYHASHRDRYCNDYLNAEAERLMVTKPEAYEELQKKLRMWDEYHERTDLELMKSITVEDFIEEHPELGILTFWQWDTEHNAQPFRWQE